MLFSIYFLNVWHILYPVSNIAVLLFDTLDNLCLAFFVIFAFCVFITFAMKVCNHSMLLVIATRVLKSELYKIV